MSNLKHDSRVTQKKKKKEKISENRKGQKDVGNTGLNIFYITSEKPPLKTLQLFQKEVRTLEMMYGLELQIKCSPAH